MKTIESENRHNKKTGKIKKVRNPIQLKGMVRKQTPEEESAYRTAMRLLIAEWSRQQFSTVQGHVP